MTVERAAVQAAGLTEEQAVWWVTEQAAEWAAGRGFFAPPNPMMKGGAKSHIHPLRSYVLALP
ncbi:MAG: hypothetical protein AB1847_07985 [bacterium]